MVKVAGRDFRQKTVIEVGRFSILWNMFENENFENNVNENKLRDVDWLSPSKHFQKLAKVLKNRSELHGFDYREYIEESLSLGNGLRPDSKTLILNFMNSDGKEFLVGGLLAIYRIRNNMFHGLKEWVDLDNQIELFAAVNKVLEEIL